jgi:hypothetical protein
MAQLMEHGGRSEMQIRNYRKDDVIVRCWVRCVPLVDHVGGGTATTCGRASSLTKQTNATTPKKVTHLGVIVLDAQVEDLFPLPNFDQTLESRGGGRSSASATFFPYYEQGRGDEEENVLEEVGMPLDRRENSNEYSKCGDLPATSVQFWRSLAGESAFSLSLTLRYMLRTQAPVVLTDRYKITTTAAAAAASCT